MPFRFSKAAGALCLALVLACLPATAQQSGAKLEGVVRDSQGLVVPGVLVVATHQLTNVSTETYTNEAGLYVFPFLLPGPYTVTAELSGFKKSSVKDFQLEVATTKTANFTLEVGEISETVSVTAESVQQVQLSTSDLGNVVASKQILELPILSRRAIDLVTLEPGMSGLSAMGARSGFNSLSMDGVEITSSELGTSSSMSIATDVSPVVDTIEEFRVITGNPSAEYGRESGFKVEIATKSGTNELHGSAYEFFRGRILNANGFWNNANPLTAERRNLTRHLFGGTIGGPVWIPGVYDGRNRTFFFFNYDATRQSQDINVTRSVLTKEMRQGLYRFITSNVTLNPETGAKMTRNERVVVDPRTGEIRPGVVGIQTLNLIEADIKYLDGIGADQTGLTKKLTDMTPLPNEFSVAFGTGDGLNTAGYRWRAPAYQYNDLYTLKIDHTVTERHTLTFRANWGSVDAYGDTVNGTYKPFPNSSYNPPRLESQRGFAFTLISRLRPTLTNELRIGLTRNMRVFPDTLGTPEVLTISMPTTNPVYWRELFLSARQTEQLSDNVTWVKNKHAIRFGFTMHSTPLNRNSGSLNIGLDFYAGTSGQGGALVNLPQLFGNPSGANPVPSNDQLTAGQLFNWVTGRFGATWTTFNAVSADEFGPIGTGKVRGFRARDYGLFFQDDWKVLPRLTLNLGVRWDFFPAPYEVNSFFVLPDRSMIAPQIDPTMVAPPVGFVPVGPKYGTKIYANDTNNFAPVFGFSWDPFGSNKTAIRGSYRISYDHFLSTTLGDVESSIPGLTYTSYTNGDTLTRTLGLVNAFGQQRNPRLADLMAMRTYLGTSVGTGSVDIPSYLDVRAVQKPLASIPNTRNSMSPGQFEEHLVNPYSQSWSFGIQREIWRNTVIEARYVGRKGTKEYAGLPSNQFRAPAELIQGLRELQSLLKMTYAEAYAKAGLPLPSGVNPSALTVISDYYGSKPSSATSISQWKPGRLESIRPGSQILFNFLLAGTPTFATNIATNMNNNNLPTTLGQMDASGPYMNNTFLASAGFKPVPAGVSSRGWLPSAIGLADNTFRPNPQFLNGPRLTSNAAYSNYHGMMLIFRRRFYNGLQGEFNYTLSKNLDITGTNNPVGLSVRDFFQRNADKSISGNDTTHDVEYNIIYELPFGPGKWLGSGASGWSAKLIGGWQVSAIGGFYSGGAMYAYYSNNSSGYQSNDVPDVKPGVTMKGRKGKVYLNELRQFYYFTPAEMDEIKGMFQKSQLGTIGNAPRDWIRGPGGWDLDMGLNKNVYITETKYLQFRGEFYNAFNHMNPSNPNLNMESTSFGQITGGSGGRIIQIAAKIFF